MDGATEFSRRSERPRPLGIDDSPRQPMNRLVRLLGSRCPIVVILIVCGPENSGDPMNKTKRDAGKSPGIGEELKLDGRLITTSLGAGRKCADYGPTRCFRAPRTPDDLGDAVGTAGRPFAARYPTNKPAWRNRK